MFWGMRPTVSKDSQRAPNVLREFTRAPNVFSARPECDFGARCECFGA